LDTATARNVPPFADAGGEVVRVDALQFRCSSSTLRTRGTLANARSRATWPTSPRDRRTIARVRRRRVLGRIDRFDSYPRWRLRPPASCWAHWRGKWWA